MRRISKSLGLLAIDAPHGVIPGCAAGADPLASPRNDEA
jgi:hypothetical protein